MKKIEINTKRKTVKVKAVEVKLLNGSITLLIGLAFFLSSCENKVVPIKKEVIYFKNETLKEVSYFKDGLNDGVEAIFHSNGILKSFYYYVEDEVILMNSFHDNGQLKLKGRMKGGNSEGEWLYYYYSGQLFKKGSFKDGEEIGTWIQYYEDGSIEGKIEFDGLGNEKIIINNEIEEIPD
jgi:hypothetical protein